MVKDRRRSQKDRSTYKMAKEAHLLNKVDAIAPQVSVAT